MRNRNSTGIFALLVLGGYYVWRNRFEIQRFLEARGINTPLSMRSVTDTVRSGIAKISGSTEYAVNEASDEARRVG